MVQNEISGTSRSPNKPAASEVPVEAASRDGAYVRPTPTRQRNAENSVRVNNLSKDVRDADLRELFGAYGAVRRVYVAMDQRTNTCRGFGFVNFWNRENAQRAIDDLDGYGYDHLILRVEWATPRST